jgi:putative methionine-R-sulfoxide reductase with GAF domain
MTLERRHIVRDKVHLAAFASIEGGPESTVVNLSEAGIGLQGALPAVAETPGHSEVRLSLELPATQTSIETHAVIAWRDATGRAGVRFANLAEGPRRLVREFLSLNAAAQPSAGPSPQQNALAISIREGLKLGVEVEPAPLIAPPAGTPEIVRLPISDAALQVLVERARALTSASGVAVAMLAGDAMVCRAVSGELVPSPGTRLGLGSGITAECVRKRAVLRCDDAETDPGVDRESCRALGIRAIIVVPVMYGPEVVGALEIVSSRANAFATYDPPALQRIIEQILTGRAPQGTGNGVPHQPDAPIVEAVSSATEPAPAPSVGLEAPSAEQGSRLPSRTMEMLDRLRQPDSWVIRHRIILGAVAGTVLGAVVLSFSPRLQRRAVVGAQPSAPVVAEKTSYSRQSPPPEFRKQASHGVSDLEKLARNGDADAQFSLGARYATGDEVAQDYSQAVKWFMRSAEQGHVVAQAALGACYWAGRGVPQDYVKSYMWSSLAKLGGDEASKYRVGVLRPRMSTAQIAEAQHLIQAWLRDHPERAARFSPTSQIQP